MRRTFVAGNWKMNGDGKSAAALAAGIASRVAAAGQGRPEVAVCPPYLYLSQVGAALAGSGVDLGAQNLSEHPPGAFTGEIAAEMLVDVGCRFVIVGHSERRHVLGENDAQVTAKFETGQKRGLAPILCVGELLGEREAGQTEVVVGRQLDAVIDACGVESLSHAVVAYEPVWAIGTGKTASPEQAQAVHAFVRSRVAARSEVVARSLRILYGGSVKASNAAGLFKMADIDGGLIGGASLQVEEFVAICDAAG